MYINMYTHLQGVELGALGCYSLGRGIKLQLINGVGLAIRLGIVMF
jgi:hypothetical protein